MDFVPFIIFYAILLHKTGSISAYFDGYTCIVISKFIKLAILFKSLLWIKYEATPHWNLNLLEKKPYFL